MSTAGTISNLYLRLNEASGAGTDGYIFTFRKNGTCTVVNCGPVTNLTTCSDITNSVTFALGDLISISAVDPNLPGGEDPEDYIEMRWTAKFAPIP